MMGTASRADKAEEKEGGEPMKSLISVLNKRANGDAGSYRNVYKNKSTGSYFFRVHRKGSENNGVQVAATFALPNATAEQLVTLRECLLSCLGSFGESIANTTPQNLAEIRHDLSIIQTHIHTIKPEDILRKLKYPDSVKTYASFLNQRTAWIGKLVEKNVVTESDISDYFPVPQADAVPLSAPSSAAAPQTPQGANTSASGTAVTPAAPAASPKTNADEQRTASAGLPQVSLMDELSAILATKGSIPGVKSLPLNEPTASSNLCAIDLSFDPRNPQTPKFHRDLRKGVVHAAAVRELLLHRTGVVGPLRNVPRSLDPEVKAMEQLRDQGLQGGHTATLEEEVYIDYIFMEADLKAALHAAADWPDTPVNTSSVKAPPGAGGPQGAAAAAAVASPHLPAATTPASQADRTSDVISSDSPGRSSGLGAAGPSRGMTPGQSQPASKHALTQSVEKAPQASPAFGRTNAASGPAAPGTPNPAGISLEDPDFLNIILRYIPRAVAKDNPEAGQSSKKGSSEVWQQIRQRHEAGTLLGISPHQGSETSFTISIPYFNTTLSRVDRLELAAVVEVLLAVRQCKPRNVDEATSHTIRRDMLHFVLNMTLAAKHGPSIAAYTVHAPAGGLAYPDMARLYCVVCTRLHRWAEQISRRVEKDATIVKRSGQQQFKRRRVQPAAAVNGGGSGAGGAGGGGAKEVEREPPRASLPRGGAVRAPPSTVLAESVTDGVEEGEEEAEDELWGGESGGAIAADDDAPIIVHNHNHPHSGGGFAPQQPRVQSPLGMQHEVTFSVAGRPGEGGNDGLCGVADTLLTAGVFAAKKAALPKGGRLPPFQEVEHVFSKPAQHLAEYERLMARMRRVLTLASMHCGLCPMYDGAFTRFFKAWAKDMMAPEALLHCVVFYSNIAEYSESGKQHAILQAVDTYLAE